MALKTLLGRRWPIYFTGFLLGLSAMIALFYAKQSFAPKFVDKEDKRVSLSVATGAQLRLVFVGEAEKRMAYGFPSTLYLAREEESGRWKPRLKMDYKNLVAQEHLLGPWEDGNYEIRLILYLCREPGAADCLRKLVVQPFKVESSGQKGASFQVDLNADLPESQARPMP